MTKFVKGQWVTLYGKYLQVVADLGVKVKFRLPGTHTERLIDKKRAYRHASLTPDFSKAKEGDECWLYGIGETGINSIGDNYVTVWDDENKYVFDKSGYLYFIGEYIGDAYTQGVSCELEEFPMLFNSFAQFQAYWAEQALEMGGKS